MRPPGNISAQTWDVVVAGGGHAGIEAALAASRMGCRTLLVTLEPEAIGRMSCNPAIGGLAKGHLVREIDALGGEMGLAADQTGLQYKTLNKSKGRAVWSPRAQIDKRAYTVRMKIVIDEEKNLTLIKGEITGVVLKGQRLEGVILNHEKRLPARAAILTCGTFLNGLIHIGDRKYRAGRMGERHSRGITEALTTLGFRAGRLKTGTCSQSMESWRSRGHVPVLSRPAWNPMVVSASVIPRDGRSPMRPARYLRSPIWISPLRNVPQVRIAARARSLFS